MKIRAYAQPVKDWRLETFKCDIDLLEEQIQAGLATAIGDDLPITGGAVYNWPQLGLKESRRKALEVSSLSKAKPRASSRD